jgi:hypothetical protein
MPSDSGTPKKRPNPVLSRMEANIFPVLKEIGVFLSNHIEKILYRDMYISLYTCGYKNAGILSKFNENQSPAIVDTVRFQLGEPILYGEIDEEEKVATFGIFYAKKSPLFLFFPGQLIVINRAVDVAKQQMLSLLNQDLYLNGSGTKQPKIVTSKCSVLGMILKENLVKLLSGLKKRK